MHRRIHNGVIPILVFPSYSETRVSTLFLNTCFDAIPKHVLLQNSQLRFRNAESIISGCIIICRKILLFTYLYLWINVSKPPEICFVLPSSLHSVTNLGDWIGLKFCGKFGTVMKFEVVFDFFRPIRSNRAVLVVFVKTFFFNVTSVWLGIQKKL